MRTMMILTCAFFALVAFAKADGLTEQEQKCFDAINEFRAQHKLPPLTLDETLTASSRSWSKTMARTRNFRHAGVGGENIAMGHDDGKTTFHQWERSSGHRAFLLSGTTTHAGIGNEGLYWTFRAVNRDKKPVAEKPQATKSVNVTKKRKTYVPNQPARNVLRTLFL